jgi:carbon storage regulator
LIKFYQSFTKNQQEKGQVMLVLTRKTGQSIVIDGGIEITVLEVRGEQVRLGLAAPREIRVNRKELLLKQMAEEQNAGLPPMQPSVEPFED